MAGRPSCWPDAGRRGLTFMVAVAVREALVHAALRFEKRIIDHPGVVGGCRKSAGSPG